MASKAYFFLFALGAFSFVAKAEQFECKGNLSLVGKCEVIRGRVSAYNGTPSIRIWPVGTKRLLGVLPDEGDGLPKNLERVASHKEKAFAVIEVCPLSVSKPGEMQLVCIVSATNITFRPN